MRKKQKIDRDQEVCRFESVCRSSFLFRLLCLREVGSVSSPSRRDVKPKPNKAWPAHVKEPAVDQEPCGKFCSNSTTLGITLTWLFSKKPK